ncbi:hypothetical protein [Octadecabacter ascidiaceicola]|uniref:Uncharacterized protein n=1 Tax=Octadecabacter ascidiaceicola TaxID=1655543 RepID=A0A238JQT3_9RHOB|nr:hypothetical protein [Octadecabacter ascidiaceicola]SMX33019.1 hypothetical protein OCA8868_00866 [Octadecabacter ascidiaceicola]
MISFRSSIVFWIMSATSAIACESTDIVFSDVEIQSEAESVNVGGWGRQIEFVVTNSSICTLEYLKVVLVGRNSEQQIGVRDEFQVFYSGSLPDGLRPDEQLVARPILVDRSFDVMFETSTVEIQVSESRYRQ